MLLVGAAACDTGDGRTMRPPSDAQRAALSTTTSTSSTTSTFAPLPIGAVTTSTALPTVAAAPFELTLPWADGGAIDVRFTCDGDDRSPQMQWTQPPPGTIELALLVTDDDAGGYVHWAVAGIPPLAAGNGEGAAITGGLEGRNDAGTTGWTGPCPPPGAPHTYRFTLYALSQQAEVVEDFTGADLIAIAEASAIAVAEVTGSYSR